MEKNIKDYLHLYYGCEVARFDHNQVQYKSVVNRAWLLQAIEDLSKGGQLYYTYKLILRPLSDATLEEAEHCKPLYKQDKWGMQTIESQAEVTRYLLSRGFDLFNLISDGLAIDKAKVSNYQTIDKQS